jgi:hypothetical protein
MAKKPAIDRVFLGGLVEQQSGRPRTAYLFRNPSTKDVLTASPGVGRGAARQAAALELLAGTAGAGIVARDAFG